MENPFKKHRSPSSRTKPKNPRRQRPRKSERRRAKLGIERRSARLVVALVSGLLAPLVMLTACSRDLSIPRQKSEPDPMSSSQWRSQMAWLDAQEDGDFYLFVRRYDKAEQAFQLAAKEAKAFGRNDPRGARSLTGLARVALAKRDFKGAAASFQEALSIKRKAYGNYNSDVSDLMTELARAQV